MDRTSAWGESCSCEGLVKVRSLFCTGSGHSERLSVLGYQGGEAI